MIALMTLVSIREALYNFLMQGWGHIQGLVHTAKALTPPHRPQLRRGAVRSLCQLQKKRVERVGLGGLKILQISGFL